MSSDTSQPDTQQPDEARAGARWWSVDIHSHSPASFDFGGLEGRASTEPKPSFKDWVRAFIDAGLDGIVVADHNTHEGVEQAREALADLKGEDPSIEFTIFPGVEITAHGGTHVLAVLDPESDAESINRIITLSGFEGAAGGVTKPLAIRCSISRPPCRPTAGSACRPMPIRSEESSASTHVTSMHWPVAAM